MPLGRGSVSPTVESHDRIGDGSATKRGQLRVAAWPDGRRPRGPNGASRPSPPATSRSARYIAPLLSFALPEHARPTVCAAEVPYALPEHVWTFTRSVCTHSFTRLSVAQLGGPDE